MCLYVPRFLIPERDSYILACDIRESSLLSGVVGVYILVILGGIPVRQHLLIATKDTKLWSAMIATISKGHSRNNNNNNVRFFPTRALQADLRR